MKNKSLLLTASFLIGSGVVFSQNQEMKTPRNLKQAAVSVKVEPNARQASQEKSRIQQEAIPLKTSEKRRSRGDSKLTKEHLRSK